MRASTILILLVLAALQARAAYGTPLPQDERLQAAFDILLKADAVYDSSVGDAAARTKEYEAFEALWRAGKPAESYARRLTRSGAPAARVYGILLLAQINEAAARAELPRLEEESTSVLVWSGCMALPQTIGDIALRVAGGEYVIETPTGKWSAEGMARPQHRLPN